MKPHSKSAVPWIIAALLAAALVFVLVTRRGAPGSAGTPHASAGPAAAPTPGRRILYWVDPMVPGYKSDKPGRSPFMDMDLVPVYEDQAGASGTSAAAVPGYAGIALSPERQQAIGIRLGKAEVSDLSQTVRTVGRVALDETRLYQVRAKFEGYVEELYVDYTGKPVRRGKPLLSIYSPELLATQQEYLLALRAKQRLGGSPNAEVARGAQDLLESARQRLLLWDIRPADIERLEKTGEPRKALTLTSPVDGFVLSKNAIRGGRVMPSDTLFEIGSLSPIWVLADVYESEAGLVRQGSAAKVTLTGMPGRTWNGKVTFIAPVLEEATRTLKVRLELANPDGALKPGMFADVMLERPLGRVLSVPEDAILTTGTRSIAFVARAGNRFEPREVQVGARVGGRYQVISGLEPGEEVVTQANFLVDSESRLKAALGEMTGASPAAATPGVPAPTPTASGHVH
jgi:Cu(I)/Ag(I) efflux system membrane fusion protein